MKEPIRVIIDTNVWISYLIGYQLQSLDGFLKSGTIQLIVSEDLLKELINIADRKKFRKYFGQSDVDKLLRFIRLVADVIQPLETMQVCRDPKDDFLLALAEEGGADYLITGDNDLLDLKKYGKTKIIKPSEFSIEQ